MPINFDPALGSHEAALYLRERRTSVLASNLANADTPGYKARDLDFKTALAAQKNGTVGLRTTHEGHIGGAGSREIGGELLYRVPQQSSLDGNTVEVQAEQAAFAENAIQYQATLRFLTGRFMGLKNALKEN